MKYPEKKARNREYRVRRAPVTHAIDVSRIVSGGARRAVCCIRAGRPRHDDGFSLDLSQVDCEHCKRALRPPGDDDQELNSTAGPGPGVCL